MRARRARFRQTTGVVAAALLFLLAAASGLWHDLDARPAQARDGAHPSAAQPDIRLFRETVGDRAYLLAMIVPPAAEQVGARAPRDLVFVLPAPGALPAHAVAGAAAAIGDALARLHPGDRFNLVRADAAPDRLFEAPAEATVANLAAARAFLARRGPSVEAPVVPAIEAALADPASREPRPRQVVALVGDIASHEAGLLHAVAKSRGRARLYPVGVGADADAAVLRRAAEVGRGAHLAVKSPEVLETHLRTLLAKLEHPVLTDPRAEWTPGVRVDASPDPLPDLFAGEPFVLAAQLSSLKGDLTIGGQLGGRPWKASLRLADARPSAGVARLWAARKIASLNARRWSGQDPAAIEAAIREVENALPTDGAEARAAVGPDRAREPAADASRAPNWTIANFLGPRQGRAEPGEASDARPAAPAPLARPFASANRMFGDRLLAVAIMALFFAGMCAVTLGFWRHLSREYVSTRRPGRGT